MLQDVDKGKILYMKRKTLAFILKFLSKWAIKKHGMKIIVVAGTHGTKLTGEFLSEALQPEYVIRKQLEASFWDFSIPLAILGFDDKRYSTWGWLSLLIRALFMLVFGESNFTWTLLQMNTYSKKIAMYWMNILEPEISIIVNTKRSLRALESLLASKTRELVVVSSDDMGFDQSVLQKNCRLILVGKDKDSDVVIDDIKEKDNGLYFSVRSRINKNQVVKGKVFAFQKGDFMRKPLIVVIASLLGLEFTLAEVKEKLAHAEVSIERFIVGNS